TEEAGHPEGSCTDDEGQAEEGGGPLEDARQEAESQAQQPGFRRVRGTSFRGSAAAEYIAAASEKVRQSYEKTPFQLLAPAPSAVPEDSQKSSAGKLRHVQVQLDSPHAEAKAKDFNVHRRAELLDEERTQIQQQLRRQE
ncbi:unnamed protein product, partial [Polarella glacialis]